MEISDPPDLGPGLLFLSECLVAISQQEYRNALKIATAGLRGLLRADVPVDAQQLASGFYLTVNYLESNLKLAEDEQVRAPFQEIKQLRCSFCGKEPKEVENMIAGPGVFICDGCIGICNGILGSSRNTV